MTAFEKEIKDYFKIGAIAFLPGIIFAIVLSAITTAIAGFASWVIWIIYAILLIWAVPKLPKEIDTFWEVLIVTFILSAFTGLIGAIVPSIGQYLGWVSLANLTTWFSMLVVAVLTLSILDKYTDWL